MSGTKTLKIDLGEHGGEKLSVFLPICKEMLILGPAWFDRYVRANMEEACKNIQKRDYKGVISSIGLPDSARRQIYRLLKAEFEPAQ